MNLLADKSENSNFHEQINLTIHEFRKAFGRWCGVLIIKIFSSSLQISLNLN